MRSSGIGTERMTAGDRLSLFSRAVRESTLKRLRQVRPGDEEWRPAAGALSFVDVLKHLVEADAWIMAYLNGSTAPRAIISPGDGAGRNWGKLLRDLERSGEKRASRLGSMTDSDLSRAVVEPQVLGETTYWWLVVRGCLDHEIHHRGALQLALRLRYGGIAVPDASR